TLTAVALSGATSTSTRKITLQPPTTPPTPTPATATLGTGQVAMGSIPVAYTGTLVTITFDTHGSTGSTFTLNGNQYTYTAGTTTGTDVVRLTVAGGACGTATSTFTATVIAPGDPAVVFFTADPARGCGTSTNVVLQWQTVNTRSVDIDPVAAPFGLAPNGSVGTTISGSTTFTLTAFPLLTGGPTATAMLTVPVDSQAYTPILTPSSVSVPAGSGYVFITVTGVADPTLIRYVVVQNKSGSHFSTTDTPGVLAYLPGPFGDSFGNFVDVIRVFYTNGCGPRFTEFTATVN
ncbi:MAG: hypothetical protein ABI584_06945, partial [Acidobacteriota bacterium]